MTEAEYRAAPGLNQSTLKNMAKSPAHYLYYLKHPQEDKAAFLFGRALHAAVLTPTAYKRDFAIIPEGIDRRTKAGREEYEQFTTAAAGKEIITQQDADTIKQMVKAIRANKDAAELLKGTKRERPLFWTDETGTLCKCRIDAYKPGIIIDLKTAANAETDTFCREAMKYLYPLQIAHYVNGYMHKVSSAVPQWYFIVCEKTPPYCVNVLRADPALIDYGYIMRQQLIKRLKQCEEENNFPGYGLNDFILPAWAEV